MTWERLATQCWIDKYIKTYIHYAPQLVSGKIHKNKLRISKSGYDKLAYSRTSHQNKQKSGVKKKKNLREGIGELPRQRRFEDPRCWGEKKKTLWCEPDLSRCFLVQSLCLFLRTAGSSIHSAEPKAVVKRQKGKPKFISCLQLERKIELTVTTTARLRGSTSEKAESRVKI